MATWVGRVYCYNCCWCC